MRKIFAARLPAGRRWQGRSYVKGGNMKMYTATIKEEALKPRSASSYYARQKLLFIAVVVLVSVLPLIGLSVFSFQYYKNSWVEGTSTELAGLADSRKEVIELFLADQNNLLESLMDLYPPEYLSNQANLERVFQAINRSGVITDLGIIDASGVHRSYVGPFGQQLANKNYAETDWFAQVMSQGRYTSDIFTGFRGIPHFVVAVADPSRSFVIRATVNSDMFNSLLDSAEVGPDGDAFILSNEGEPQTPTRLGSTEVPFSLSEPAAGDGASVHQTEDFIYAASSLKDGEWVLVLKEDVGSSLSEFYSARNRAIVLIGLAILIITSVAAVLSSSIINRIKDADIKRMALNNRVLEMEKMALIGRLASSVSHEINNPLQIIENQAGWIEELLEDEKSDRPHNVDEYRDAAEKIRAHVRRAKAITHRLLGFSRAGAAEPAMTDINLLLEETVSFLETEANNNHIEIKRDLWAGLPQVPTDAAQLQQVFLNILNNAIEAIGREGSITIRTGLANGSVFTEISDTGPGLSEETKRSIFDPFYTTKSGKNAGLGLSISYNIVQRLHGEILARNQEQGGTVFSVSLPVDIEDEKSTEKR